MNIAIPLPLPVIICVDLDGTVKMAQEAPLGLLLAGGPPAFIHTWVSEDGAPMWGPCDDAPTDPRVEGYEKDLSILPQQTLPGVPHIVLYRPVGWRRLQARTDAVPFSLDDERDERDQT